MYIFERLNYCFCFKCEISNLFLSCRCLSLKPAVIQHKEMDTCTTHYDQKHLRLEVHTLVSTELVNRTWDDQSTALKFHEDEEKYNDR